MFKTQKISGKFSKNTVDVEIQLYLKSKYFSNCSLDKENVIVSDYYSWYILLRKYHSNVVPRKVLQSFCWQEISIVYCHRAN